MDNCILSDKKIWLVIQNKNTCIFSFGIAFDKEKEDLITAGITQKEAELCSKELNKILVGVESKFNKK